MSMFDNVNGVELTVFTILFIAVSVLGFLAARWRRAEDLEHLDEWGLGGRSFGSWVTWFLIGGDLYTAYTFVAVPALVFGAGAIGFFAVPYTIVVYPIVFLVLIRLWSVSHVHGFVTPADFVRARHGSSTLALLVAITGIVATMPYIALQLVGIEAVLKAMGVTGHLPIIVAFAILAAYTYSSGLRAPALIAFVKDALIYLVIIVAVIVIPYKLGGWDQIFGAAEEKFAASPTPADGVLLAGPVQLQYATLAFGSALALFLYPHSITGVLASRDRNVIKRNMAALPAYSFILGLLALLGYMAIKAGRGADRGGQRRRPTTTPSCRCCSTRCSRAGSLVWRWRRSASGRWCRRRSCRSRRRTCGPATSTWSTSTRTPPLPRRPRAASWPRWWSRWEPWSRSSRSTRSSPSTCS
ncbi:MAG: hypothetical protein WKF73_09040 [Nocardioidaceae bacterium]